MILRNIFSAGELKRTQRQDIQRYCNRQEQDNRYDPAERANLVEEKRGREEHGVGCGGQLERRAKIGQRPEKDKPC